LSVAFDFLGKLWMNKEVVKRIKIEQCVRDLLEKMGQPRGPVGEARAEYTQRGYSYK
jgi:hypothetical protein